MFQTILLPVDLAHKDAAAKMLETARRFAGDDTRFVLLNVVAEIPSYAAAEIPGDYFGKVTKAATAELTELKEQLDLDCEVMVRRGRAGTAILNAAESLSADLIVIASHDPGLEDYFLGSTASRVVRHAHCSVVVLR